MAILSLTTNTHGAMVSIHPQISYSTHQSFFQNKLTILQSLQLISSFFSFWFEIQWQTSSSWSLLLGLDFLIQIRHQTTTKVEISRLLKTTTPFFWTGWKGFLSTKPEISSSPEKVMQGTTCLSSPRKSFKTTRSPTKLSST